jgi:hypothetical protein
MRLSNAIFFMKPADSWMRRVSTPDPDIALDPEGFPDCSGL